MKKALASLILLSSVCGYAEKMQVTVIKKDISTRNIPTTIPGSIETETNPFSGKTTTTYNPASVTTRTFADVTVTLELQDGRRVIASCFNCLIPLQDKLTADFSGKKVKLIWPVSIDGKKTDSQVFRILSVMPAP